MCYFSRTLFTAAAFCLASIGALAQQSATSTASAPVSTFTVTVGKGGNQFVPQVIQTNVGDVVEFLFYPQNHTVARSEYLYPCIPYEKIAIGKTGFFSGFHPVDAVLTNPPTWSLTINSTEPIFFYCTAPGSCINFQMIGVINPNATQLLSTQKAYAANSTYMLIPGQDFPDESPTSSTSSSSSSVAVSTTTVSAATSSAVAQNTDQKSSFPAGAIAGIVVGVVIIIALAAALFYFVGRHRTVKTQEAAAGIFGQEKMGSMGSNSPAAPTPGAPVVGPGGMVYVPVATSDLHRMSIPPTYGHADPSQRVSAISNPDGSPTLPPPSSPPAEIYATFRH